jgi:hypothetical protein
VNRIGEEAWTVGLRESDGSGDGGRAARHALRLQALRLAASLANDVLGHSAERSMVGAGVPLGGKPEPRQPATPGLVQPASRQTR